MYYKESDWSKDPKKSPHGDFYKDYKTLPSAKPVKKPAVTVSDLFPSISRWGIGFDPVFAHLQSFTTSTSAPSYPPYNVKKLENGTWRIDVAVAGFRKDELKIWVEDRTLTIHSDPVFGEVDAELENAEVIHQGIAQRNFTLNFALADYVEVDKAEYSDGILTVKLTMNLPEEKKPKVVDII